MEQTARAIAQRLREHGHIAYLPGCVRRCCAAFRSSTKLSTSAALFRKNAPDYVIRGFDASPARLKKPQGLDLRWDIALRDLQVQLEP
jgi:hypothetical protein